MAGSSLQTDGAQKPLFLDLEAPVDMDKLEQSEIESLCMKCYKQGTTQILLTKIPMFREVILSSFYCPHCGEKNTEIQPGAPIQDKGVRFTLTINDIKYLNRLLVKTESATIKIPEVDFEIPAHSRKGQITTVEGVINQAIANLESEQPYRMETQPEIGRKIEEFLSKLKNLLEVKIPYTVILDDPSGNSFVQGDDAGEGDDCLMAEHYQRTQQQDEQIGIITAASEPTEDEEDAEGNTVDKDEVVAFQTNCSHCQSPVETRMKLVDIPHFKQVVLMATNCEYCGHRSNEVKSGSGVSDLGTKITLKLTDVSDLSRDILKAETAKLLIPELNFEVQSGTLGGCFTTVEGLLTQARDQLKNLHPFSFGDSASEEGHKLGTFVSEMNKIIDGEQLNVHIILDDPAGNSYIQNLYAPESDPEMTVEKYERNSDQNEELGLNDMKTENYCSKT